MTSLFLCIVDMECTVNRTCVHARFLFSCAAAAAVVFITHSSCLFHFWVRRGVTYLPKGPVPPPVVPMEAP